MSSPVPVDVERAAEACAVRLARHFGDPGDPPKRTWIDAFRQEILSCAVEPEGWRDHPPTTEELNALPNHEAFYVHDDGRRMHLRHVEIRKSHEGSAIASDQVWSARLCRGTIGVATTAPLCAGRWLGPFTVENLVASSTPAPSASDEEEAAKFFDFGAIRDWYLQMHGDLKAIPMASPADERKRLASLLSRVRGEEREAAARLACDAARKYEGNTVAAKSDPDGPFDCSDDEIAATALRWLASAIRAGAKPKKEERHA